MELAAIAAILTAGGGVLKLILDHLTKQREGFETFMGNHMSAMARTVEDNSKAIRANTEVIQDAVRELRDARN